MNEDWSNIEVELIVADYFSMLVDELKGIAINKTEHRRLLLPLLNNRSDGSIEFKHQNVSAILINLGMPFIKGYKPRFNFQSILIDIVTNYINSNLHLEKEFEIFSEEASNLVFNEQIKFENWVVPIPESMMTSEPIVSYRRPVKINYIEREQQNRKLGLLGEELVVEYEKWLLIEAGKESLADKIEWISKQQGDGLGFDILSKNLNGSDKYIEVKTTKLSKETPIFFTKNEFNFSIENSDNFYLYRVFDFSKNPMMFNVKGRYDNFCRIEAIQYKGKF